MGDPQGQAEQHVRSGREGRPSGMRHNAFAHLSPLAAPGTALAVAGAAWYGLLNFGAAIAYEPLGVQPREVGLGSSELLAQSAVGLAVALLVMVFGYGLQWSLLWMFGIRDPPPHRGPFRLAYLAVGLVCAPVFVVSSALEARGDLRDGRRPASLFGTGSPWRGEIATLAWAGAKPNDFGDLPPCALYLGEVDGTAVIYEPTQRRTMRMPSSTLIVTTRRDKAQC